MSEYVVLTKDGNSISGEVIPHASDEPRVIRAAGRVWYEPTWRRAGWQIITARPAMEA